MHKILIDKVGGLEKATKLKRMEPYADIIGEVFAKYNKDDDKRTMMFKLIRHPVEGTTTRKKHTENVKEIAEAIASKFNWLNSKIISVMAKEHDTGHTFLGHSGEWWISSINETYGLPNYVHNATGARKLAYKENVYKEVEDAILDKYPNISRNKLTKIKRDLWLVIDGINCHNGEKSERSYAPDFSKGRNRFEKEIMKCYIEKGADRKLIPATAEGSLMRLCDKISYIPFDMVDIFRNGVNLKSGIRNGEEHNFYDEYKKQLAAMGMPEHSFDKLLNCKTEEEYDNFAHEMQRYLIRDVVKNTRRNNIRMSAEMSNAMHTIRDINNNVMVNYVVMREDHEAYPPSIEKLMKYYSKILTSSRLIDSRNPKSSNIKEFYDKKSDLANHFISTYEYNPVAKGFAKFVSNINEEDFNFTVESVKQSLEHAINSEIDIAQKVALGLIPSDSIQAKGNKKERINTYINSFRKSLERAYEENIFKEDSRNPVNIFKRKVWLNKAKEKIKKEALSLNPKYENSAGTISLNEMIGMDMAAQYISSLNDEQFFELIQQAKLITPEQAESLQRPYTSFDFRTEHKKHSDWDNIAKLQRAGTEAEKDSMNNQKKSFRERFFGR